MSYSTLHKYDIDVRKMINNMKALAEIDCVTPSLLCIVIKEWQVFYTIGDNDRRAKI